MACSEPPSSYRNRLLGPFLPHSEGPVTPREWSSLDGTLFIDEAGLSGDPILLFRASEAPWPTPFVSGKYKNQVNYVTDGPFLFRAAGGGLLMLWASFIRNTYALGVSRSATGRVTGPWVHEAKPLYREDGGKIRLL